MQIIILPWTNMYKGTHHVQAVVPACHQLFCFNPHKEANHHPESTGEETGTGALSDLSKVTHPGSGEHRTGSQGVLESARAESGHLFPTRIQCHHLGSLKPAMAGIFINRQRLPISFSPWRATVNIYQHSPDAVAGGRLFPSVSIGLWF